MDKLRALRYFKRVAELRSFTLTAIEFEVPSSSISRRIHDLETSLGVELLKRTTRNVRLTELGAVYYEMINGSLAELDRADELVSDSLESPSGVLHISSMPSYGEQILTPVLFRFQEAFPTLQLDLVYSDDLTVFGQDSIDIAIRGGYVPDTRVVAKRLASNKFILVAHPEYAKQIGSYKPISLSVIESCSTLQYRGPNGLISWYASVENQWVKLNLQPKLISNNGRTLVGAALLGRGLALMPLWGVKSYLDNGALVEIKTECPINVSQDKDIGINLLYQKGRYQVPKIKLCVDYLIDHIKDE